MAERTCCCDNLIASDYYIFLTFRLDSPRNPDLAPGIAMLITCVHLRLNMHRLIARLLLVVALVGNFGPLVLAATARSPHACCVRKAVHHCNDSLATDAGQLLIREARCCNHDCCRAVTTARWAHAQPTTRASFAQIFEPYFGKSSPDSTHPGLFDLQSARAPPHFFTV
jgi:hypothetical protein